MGSYSGQDSVGVVLDVRVLKLPNSTLTFFEEENKTNFVDVWIKEDGIDKFYFHDLDIDLKDLIDEKTIQFIKDFYNKNDSKNIMREVDFTISYDVSGHYDPGRSYGPPEDCYPEDWDEERTVTAAELVFDYKNKVIVDIPNQFLEKVYDAFQKEIDNNEFSPPDYEDYDDREHDYDYDYDRY